LKNENEFRYGYKVVVIFRTLIAETKLFGYRFSSLKWTMTIYSTFAWAGKREHKISPDDK
jgi:hypothetical protein